MNEIKALKSLSPNAFGDEVLLSGIKGQFLVTCKLKTVKTIITLNLTPYVWLWRL